MVPHEFVDKDQRFSYIYPDGTNDLGKALFPSLFLVRRWDDGVREFQVNFSRKINAPTIGRSCPS